MTPIAHSRRGFAPPSCDRRASHRSAPCARARQGADSCGKLRRIPARADMPRHIEPTTTRGMLMLWVQLVTLLAVLQFLVFGFLVGKARATHNVPAPAMSGHPGFERYFRVH